jgi:hypothetical protein
MSKIALIECVKMPKIALECYFFQSYTAVSNTDLYLSYNFQTTYVENFEPLIKYNIHSTDLFECYCWQNYTTISNTDLYLSYFDLSYVFPGHNDSVQKGLTVSL